MCPPDIAVGTAHPAKFAAYSARPARIHQPGMVRLMTAQHAARRHNEARFWLLLLAAFFLRVGVLWKFGGSLAEDRDNYRAIAERVVAGEGFVDPQSHLPTAYRPPLYPLLVAAVRFFGGGNLAIGLVQVVLGVATSVLTVS